MVLSNWKKGLIGFLLIVLITLGAGGLFVFSLMAPADREQLILLSIPFPEQYARFRARKNIEPLREIPVQHAIDGWTRVRIVVNSFSSQTKEREYSVAYPEPYLIAVSDSKWSSYFFRSEDYDPDLPVYRQDGPSLLVICTEIYADTARVAEILALVDTFLPGFRDEEPPLFTVAFPIIIGGHNGWRALGPEESPYRLESTTFIDIETENCEFANSRAKDEISDEEYERFLGVADSVMSSLRFEGEVERTQQ